MVTHTLFNGVNSVLEVYFHYLYRDDPDLDQSPRDLYICVRVMTFANKNRYHWSNVRLNRSVISRISIKCIYVSASSQNFIPSKMTPICHFSRKTYKCSLLLEKVRLALVFLKTRNKVWFFKKNLNFFLILKVLSVQRKM